MSTDNETFENRCLLPRDSDGHKGSYGRVLIIGGSRGMAGAPALAGISALKSGAGLVTLAIPDTILETVASLFPCYTTVPLPVDGGNARRICAFNDRRVDAILNLRRRWAGTWT